MEAHEQPVIETSSTNTLVSPPQAESTPAVDPLADASCLRCGYSLRGLTENRCPECGTPFDPQEMASSYLPEWPRLMVWYLTAACLAGSLQLMSQVLWTLSVRQSFSSMIDGVHNLIQAFTPGTTIVIAPFAIIGLIRRIDLGRKIAIALFVVLGLSLLPACAYVILRLMRTFSYAAGFGLDMIYDLIPAWTLASQVSLPSITLACVLSTRLRRKSLRRSPFDPPPLLPRRLFSPRGDWLLVLVTLLAAGAIECFGSLGTTALWLIEFSTSRASFGDSWGRTVASLVSWGLLAAVQCVWLAWIARAIWRDPASVRWHLKVFLIVAIVCIAVSHLINMLLRIETYSFSSPGTAFLRVSGTLAYSLAWVVTPLALYLYASRVLPAEAIARVTEPPQQPTGPNASDSADG